MHSDDTFDWAGASAAEQMRHIRAKDVAEWNRILRVYDWSQHPEPVLGWLTAQQGIELGAALAAFFNGDPMRFNYVPPRDVTAEYGAAVRLLDSIFRRINAGFYLPHPLFCEVKLAKLEAWMRYQQEDARERQSGRWVFDPEVLEPIRGPQVIGFDTYVAEPEAAPEGFSLKALLRPLVG